MLAADCSSQSILHPNTDHLRDMEAAQHPHTFLKENFPPYSQKMGSVLSVGK